MNLRRYIKLLRSYRLYHRYLGTTLAFFLCISAITGIFLALKKEFNFIQPTTQKGVSVDLESWKPIDEISAIASATFYQKYPDQQSNTINKIVVHPKKGIAKVLFEKGYWEVQVDGTNGAVLSVGRRHSDWIESLHDGSIISDPFKVISMNLLGFGVLVLIASGLWLWYGPKLVKKMRKRSRAQKINQK